VELRTYPALAIGIITKMRFAEISFPGERAGNILITLTASDGMDFSVSDDRVRLTKAAETKGRGPDHTVADPTA
jgi:hypothetical protein